jgi:hypothetical protein
MAGPCWVGLEQELRGVPLQVSGLLLGAPQRLLDVRVAVEGDVEQVSTLLEDPPDRLEPLLRVGAPWVLCGRPG